MKRTTIGIDARTLTYPESCERGIGQYTINHLSVLVPLTPQWQYILLVEEIESNPVLEGLAVFPNLRVLSYCDIEPGELDLFHIPDPMGIFMGFDSPFRIVQGVPRTMVFHDLTPLILAKEYLDTWPSWAQLVYRSRLKQVQKSSAKILSVSQNTRDDLAERLGIASDRLIVVHAGLNQTSAAGLLQVQNVEATLKKFSLVRPFFLCVGGQEPHKRFDLALGSFVALSKQFPSQLAVVGSLDDPWKLHYRKVIENQKIPGVVFTGFVNRAELAMLYSKAQALVFPSIYEGFGLPVLEAMAHGCPVIACNSSSIPEVAGNAALLFPPGKPDEIVTFMCRLATDMRLRRTLSQMGRVQASKFTWEDVARRTIEVFEVVLSNSRQEVAKHGTALDLSGNSYGMGNHFPDEILDVSLKGAVEQLPELSTSIERVNRYLREGKYALASKIVRKELGSLPESEGILHKIQQLQPRAYAPPMA